MRLDRSELSKAVQTALSLGAVAAVGVAGTAFAQNATTTQNDQNNPQTLQTIVVTGSHIRRVDLETSNPVVAVTSQQIQQTGKLTLGDVIQQLPVITGGIRLFRWVPSLPWVLPVLPSRRTPPRRRTTRTTRKPCRPSWSRVRTFAAWIWKRPTPWSPSPRSKSSRLAS